jgi:hypothetical protein
MKGLNQILKKNNHSGDMLTVVFNRSPVSKQIQFLEDEQEFDLLRFIYLTKPADF